MRNLLLIAALIFFAWTQIPGWYTHWKMEGEQATASTVVDLDGSPVHVPMIENHPYILIFWATWCGPCQVEMNRFKKAIDEKEIDGNFVYAINFGENPDLVRLHVQEHKFPFHVFLDSSGELVRRYKVQATPTLIYVGSDNKIVWATSGMSPLAISRAKDLFQQPIEK